MKKIYPSSQFKRDYKRYRNNPEKLADLKVIIDLLANESPIPPKFKPHKLTGDYKGCLECHIQNDFLLIWFDPEQEVIELVRMGSHSELFK